MVGSFILESALQQYSTYKIQKVIPTSWEVLGTELGNRFASPLGEMRAFTKIKHLYQKTRK